MLQSSETKPSFVLFSCPLVWSLNGHCAFAATGPVVMDSCQMAELLGLTRPRTALIGTTVTLSGLFPSVTGAAML